MVPKNLPLLNILKNHGKSKYVIPQSSWNYHWAVFKIPLWNSMQNPGWFRMWFFLLDHQKNPNKLRSHCSPNESTNQALALRKILVVHRIPTGPSPGPVRTTGMGNGGLWPRKMVTCHVWSIGIRSRGSHTLHTSHNHWKGKSMEKWWIWIYDMILFYHILSNHCVSFKENRHFHENKGCKSMDHDHDPTKKGPWWHNSKPILIIFGGVHRSHHVSPFGENQIPEEQEIVVSVCTVL